MGTLGAHLRADLRLFRRVLGTRVKELRLARRMTRRVLASFIGITDRMLEYVEKGQKCLSLNAASRLCIALQIPLSTLIEGTTLPKRIRKKTDRQVVVTKRGVSKIYKRGTDRSRYYARLKREREARGEPPRPRGWNFRGNQYWLTKAKKKNPNVPPVVNKNRDRKRRLREKKRNKATKKQGST